MEMGKERLEAFSDGVLAIIITIMVLEFNVPHSAMLSALKPIFPPFLSYVLSFIYIAIYWNNHHHMLKAAHRTNGAILWANMNLLFWLSLVPFATAWMGENHFAPIPTVLYGVVLLFSAIAYMILQGAIINEHGTDSIIARALQGSLKGKLSIVLYLIAILFALTFHAHIAQALYALVAMMWFVPERRIEKMMRR